MEINPLSRNDAEQMISFLLKEEAKSEVNLASSFMSAENHEETRWWKR